MFLFPIGFFYAYFMVAGKRIAAKQRKEKAVFLGMESGCAQTPASISSSRLQDRNFTQRGPWKSIEDDFMGKRRNCGVNEHLCFLHRCERYAASDDEVYNCALFHRGFGTLLHS